MSSEGRQRDHKRSFETNSQKADLELVKDVVAMANSGGGTLVFGRTDTDVFGLSEAEVSALDSARVSDLVDKFIAPNTIRLSHSVQRLAGEKVILTLTIDPEPYPIVISRDGTWRPPGEKLDKSILRRGDVWVRHSSKNERVGYEDLREWILSARRDERAQILERMAMLVNLPEGSSLEVVTTSGSRIDSPSQLIESAIQRRKTDPDHLLSPDDLLWLFLQRNGLTLSDDHLRVIVASALRRSATLYWWLAEAEHNPDLIVEELIAALSASDRDKSDAASNIVELAAVYADDPGTRQIIHGLRESEYAHFREAADAWPGRQSALRALSRRVQGAKIQGRRLSDCSIDELESVATDIAESLARRPTSAGARQLATVTRAIWARRSTRSPVSLSQG